MEICINLYSEAAKWATTVDTKQKFVSLMQNVHKEMMIAAGAAVTRDNHPGMQSQLALDKRHKNARKKKVTSPRKRRKFD